MPFEAIEATYIGDQLKANIGRLVNNMALHAVGGETPLLLSGVLLVFPCAFEPTLWAASPTERWPLAGVVPR